MAAPFVGGLTRTASKRARSTDSSRSGASTPAPKALKTQEDQVSSTDEDFSVPAFLRQSVTEIKIKFGQLEFQQALRINEGRQDPTSRWAQDNTRQTKLRNRYMNVQPWDKSRIHLRVPEGESDYINASPIALTDPRTGVMFSYIAAQGPKQIGLSHFWHMIWHQTSDVAVIVMLTQTAEGGREKCYQYFPLDEQTEAIWVDAVEATESGPAGSVRLSEAYFNEASNATIRKLLLSFGGESKIVWHMLFSGWPDFEVPQNEDRAALFELIRLSAEKNTTPSNPRIIHCSAGVGRSGSFIALEYLLAQLKSGAIADARDDEDPIYDVVNLLREQRMTMVQSEAQYSFLYEVIREQLINSQWSSEASAIQGLAPNTEAGVVTGSQEDHVRTEEDSPDKEVMEETGKAPNIL
ncbi:MAG: hypothetical protein Q9201_004179 [Fulgogasparrea decipioides]